MKRGDQIVAVYPESLHILFNLDSDYKSHHKEANYLQNDLF